jgi:hypothetical protein
MACERPHDVIEGSGRAGAPRSLDQMVSIRFPVGLLRDARLLAEARGINVSDLVRLAVTDLIEEESADPPCTAWHGVGALG